MPINNALTPEGQNALGAAFGYYPQLRRNRTLQDPRLAAEMPLQFLRGRAAATLGLPSDVANLVRSPMPMEMYGDVDYGPQTQVPYGSQELLRTLPLPPQGAAQQAAANVGAVIPLTPMEALQAARAARQAAFAGGRALGPAAARMTEGYLQRQGLMPGVVPPSSKQFNVVNRDASKIFGAGAERLRYTDPASGGSIEVLKRPDNTASVLSLEVPEAFRGKGIGESLQAKVLQEFPQMQGQVSSKAAAKTAYRLGRRPPGQPSASLDDVYKIIDENSSVNLVSPEMQRSFMPAFQAPQENAMRLAQKSAALPVENKNMLSYRGSHTAPGPDFGAPLHDLTGGGQMYPADVYSAKAAQYYGTGYPKADREAFALAQRVRGNPDAEVTMYRAVPKDEKITAINAGDWVTLSKDYAKTHGESVLDKNYKILSQKVKAKDLWTNADSIHEFGYQPQPR